MVHFDIEIVSDTVCPWCYIGYLNLQAAIISRLTTNPGDTFSLSWRPFQLNPHSPVGHTVDKRTSYESKLGIDGARTVLERVRSAGEAVGITFSFGGRIGNTLDSHRLLEFAHRQAAAADTSTSQSTAHQRSLQTRLAEELFAEYFEREQDITDHATLSRAAVKVGLSSDEKVIRAFLASAELSDVAKGEATARRDEGISGVPHFTINDEFVVEGAQEPLAFTHLFDRLARRRKAVL